MPEAVSELPFLTRLWFAWLCFFRVLADGAFAQRAWDSREPLALPEPKPQPKPAAPRSVQGTTDAAHQLLALFQREGRLVDFLEQEVASFSDADIGAVARVVHEGCRKALHRHATLAPVREEEEGARVKLAAGFDPATVKLSGNVGGAAPYEGVLRHRGWRVVKLELPVAVAGHDATVLAPAEVEL